MSYKPQKRIKFWIGAVASFIILFIIWYIEISSKTQDILFGICILVLGTLISLIIDFSFHIMHEKKQDIQIENNVKSHFPESFPIVNQKIKPAFYDKSQSESYKIINSHIDRVIKSPVEYTYETLSGNQAPVFNPNDQYLDDIYEDNIKFIVAITAENPNLWLDPTLCFYMINCCAVTLINKTNPLKNYSIKTKDFIDQAGYSQYINKEVNGLLDILQHKKDLPNFEFVRFVLFNNNQLECLKDTVLPSLKATQDLFRIQSFYINKDNIQDKLRRKYKAYLDAIDHIWEIIIESNDLVDDSIKKIINKRKENHIPEFLIIFNKNGDIVIHTYIYGKPYKTILEHNNQNITGPHEEIRRIIAYMAQYRIINTKCDWEPKEDKLNTKKSYIDIVYTN